MPAAFDVVIVAVHLESRMLTRLLIWVRESCL
jgi:hypothetical protein